MIFHGPSPLVADEVVEITRRSPAVPVQFRHERAVTALTTAHQVSIALTSVALAPLSPDDPSELSHDSEDPAELNMRARTNITHAPVMTAALASKPARAARRKPMLSRMSASQSCKSAALSALGVSRRLSSGTLPNCTLPRLRRTKLCRKKRSVTRAHAEAEVDARLDDALEADARSSPSSLSLSTTTCELYDTPVEAPQVAACVSIAAATTASTSAHPTRARCSPSADASSTPRARILLHRRWHRISSGATSSSARAGK